MSGTYGQEAGAGTLDARRAARTPALGPGAIAAIASVVSLALVFLLDRSLPPIGLSDAVGTPVRGERGWLGAESALSIGIAFVVAAALAAGVARGATDAPLDGARAGDSRAKNALASVALGAIAALVAGSFAFVGAAYADMRIWWAPRGEVWFGAAACAGLGAAGAVVAACHGGVGLRRTLTALGSIAGVLCIAGTLRVVVAGTPRIGWAPTRPLTGGEWELVGLLMRVGIAGSLVLVFLAIGMRVTRPLGPQDVEPQKVDRETGRFRFRMGWTALDRARLHAAFLLVVAAAVVLGALLWSTSRITVPPATTRLLRTVGAFLPASFPTWLVIAVTLGGIGAVAWGTAWIVLRPTTRRLVGRGHPVSAMTVAALAFLVAVPGVTIVVTRVSGDYRMLVPSTYHSVVWTALVGLILVPSLVGYVLAVRRAVSPHDPRRLTRFMAIGLAANVAVTLTVVWLGLEPDEQGSRARHEIAWIVGPPFLAALALATYAHQWMARPLHLWKRRLCVGCGYPRHIPAGDACPECGRPWTKRRARRIVGEGKG
jgi:hypothetical protein